MFSCDSSREIHAAFGSVSLGTYLIAAALRQAGYSKPDRRKDRQTENDLSCLGPRGTGIVHVRESGCLHMSDCSSESATVPACSG